MVQFFHVSQEICKSIQLPNKRCRIIIQHKPGHYPIKQKARHRQSRFKEDVGRELEKLTKTGHLSKSKLVDEECFVSLVEITVDTSEKIAINWRKTDSFINIRLYMSNEDEIQTKISVEITRDRTKRLLISDIDLDYTNCQMNVSKETSRQCIFALTRKLSSGYF